MIVEVTMSNIVVDSSAVNHGSKHISTGADPIPNATEVAGGIVKLGARGVPDATKVPKALGADIAALLTAAGYSLSPATGSDNLDNIADGSTYKRVLAAVATALNAGTFSLDNVADGTYYTRIVAAIAATINGGTFDAAKCTAFGIGANSLVQYTGSLNALYTGGAYYYNKDSTGSPSALASGAMLVLPITSTVCIQFAIITSAVLHVYARVLSSGSGTWGELFTSSATVGSDTNAGQPPEPKTQTGTVNGIGYPLAVVVEDAPSPNWTNPGGTWEYTALRINKTTSVLSTNFSGVTTGNITGLGVAGFYVILWLKRIA